MFISRRVICGLITAAFITASLPAHAKDAPAGFADLAEKLLPAVVNVSTTQTLKPSEHTQDMPQFPPGSPFEEFFKEFMERQNHQQEQQPRKATSLGSGFIVDPTGYVVTNNHVIQDADEITVMLQDNTVLKATIVGRDPKIDIALLKVDPGKHQLTAVPFGNSDVTRVGDWVLAIGNPFGLGGTVTAGIVSARARDIQAGPYDDFLQTDASINKGNSGGPMFNMDGEVIGINTMIFSPSGSGGSVGIGFAIPSSLAKPVIDDLKKFGKTRRGWLGVRIQSLDQDLAEQLGLPTDKGALVSQITADSPAAKSDLKAGDVILKFDGKEVGEMRRLPRIVAETPINKKVDMEVWRNGQHLTTSIVVGELKDEPVQQAKADAKPQSPKNAGTVSVLGITVGQLTPQLREKFGIDDQTKGIVVLDLDDSSAAAEKGVRPGDLIVDAGQQAMHAPDDLAKAVDKAKAASQHTILLRIENPQNIRYVALPLEGKPKKPSDK